MSKIKLKNVRLSFPSLFQTSMFGDDDTGKYEATFILDKVEHAEVIEQIQKQITAHKKDLKAATLGADRICLKDGDEQERPEFEGKMTIKANTKKRPLVIDRDKSPIVEGDNKVYGGCYVNAIISLWAQNNKYGKRVNGQLDGVQFNQDGEPFGDGAIAVDAFDAFGDDTDEDEGF